LTSLSYVDRPTVRDSDWKVTLFNQTDLDGLLATVSPDPSKGHLFLLAEDCLTAPAPNVKFAASPNAGSTLFYVDNFGNATKLATQTGVYGSGGFMNLPPGDINVAMTSGGTEVGSDDVPVQASTVTLLVLYPTAKSP
jgi:hypothetical protein